MLRFRQAEDIVVDDALAVDEEPDIEDQVDSCRVGERGSSLSLSLRHQRLEFLALPLRALQFTALALATEHLQCPTREFRGWGVGML